jgi:hypothetical protein
MLPEFEHMKLEFEVTLIGHTKKDNWEGIKFNCRINGQDFEYTLGMGYAKRLMVKGDHLRPFEIKKIKDEGYTVKVQVPETWKNIVNDTKTVYVDYLSKTPKLEEVLNCLFLDSMAHEESFPDWCDNFGYSNDSIKAKQIYEACIEEYFKLKKALGVNYNEVKNVIEKLEL